MKYTVKKIRENEYLMNITEGAIMLADAYKLAKNVAAEYKAITLIVTQNGVALCTYFPKLKAFQIA